MSDGNAGQLKSLPIKDRLAACPAFLRWIVDTARTELQASKVILFGSRARGSHRPTSDIDLAFDYPPENKSHWSEFSVQVHEEARTLLPLDLVDLHAVEGGLRDRILNEGVTLYDSTED